MELQTAAANINVQTQATVNDQGNKSSYDQEQDSSIHEYTYMQTQVVIKQCKLK